MTALISIPLSTYLGFLGRCRIASREYAILRNAIVENVPDLSGNIFVEFLCSIDDAELLLNHARQFYPVATPYIEEAIHLANQGGGGAAVPGLDWEYRRSASGQTWHICSNCAHWPTSDFVSAYELPRTAEVCNECLVKEKHGECSRGAAWR